MQAIAIIAAMVGKAADDDPEEDHVESAGALFSDSSILEMSVWLEWVCVIWID